MMDDEEEYISPNKWLIKDRKTSFQNKTKVSEVETKRVIGIVREKYKISTVDALKKMINAWFDKKIVVDFRWSDRYGARVKEYYIVNPEDF